MGRQHLPKAWGLVGVVLLFLAITVQAQPESEETPVSPEDAAALATFPNCACDTYRCPNGPYRIDYLRRNATATFVELVFQIELVSCPLTVPCCQILLDSLAKIEFEVQKACEPFFISASVAGFQRTTYFDTQFPTGKIRITNLNMDQFTADRALIVLRMSRNGCNTAATLCQNGDGSCKYATFESSQHKCCPICNTILPPPPMPPSPPPPSPPPPTPFPPSPPP
eukprot:CAMPEP_0202893022 /NCGR_PEP_ID=MMETSP1392-20130828/2675_1 /ASSEMBLY_ACC=CAM_ASM_000868 /TAXON_ID=225041 /ORGANISM="Chlamydomonas chlamydogama, Strain SAG 11-48b" /LENGTH=224 /DNA_ID=CAMNT_0049577201 /DNA_START=246 /DNA_END=916 /DNA_ORIENTATION=-